MTFLCHFLQPNSCSQEAYFSFHDSSVNSFSEDQIFALTEEVKIVLFT